MTTLTDEEIGAGLAALDGWAPDGRTITREYRLSGFPAAVAFVVRVSYAAEAADHHPDLDIRYDRVRVSLTTHSQGGVTGKDLALAREIQSIADEGGPAGG